jgi:thiamine-monophosphate kinase
VSELDLIRAIRRWSSNDLIGDDCAILTPPRGRQLLVTTDMLVDGVHFALATHSAYDCGWKALARGLSDIAAMGGDPHWCFVSLALTPAADRKWLAAFYRGLGALAKRHGVSLAGGDLTRSDRLSADICVVGSTPTGRALTRSGAQPGDILYVTGPLGAMAASGYTLRPHPRLDAGLQLRRLRATACMDISDGLALDLHRLALASGLSASLDEIPVAPGASLEQALSGGEDYELLFTLPPAKRPPRSAIRIGSLSGGESGKVRLQGRPLSARGWDPFARIDNRHRV